MAENGAPSDLSVAQAHAEAEAKEAARIASLPAQPSTDLPQGTAPQGDLEHLAAELAAAMREPEWTPDHLGMTTDVLAAAVAAASAEDDTDPVPVPVQRAEDEAAPASSLDEGSSSEEEGSAGGAPALEPDQQATAKAHAGDATGGPTAGAGPADHDDDTGEVSAPPRTAHESAPPTFAEPLQVAVGADCTTQPAGSVLFTQPDQGTVIVQHPGAAAGTPAPLPLAPSGGLAHGASPLRGVLAEVAAGVLEEGSLLALAGENQAPLRVLGRIDEVFGAVSQPCYVVRLTAAQCRPAQAAVSQPAAEAAPGTAEEEVAAAVAEAEEGGVQREHTLAHMDEISPGDAVVSIVEYSATVNPALCRVAPATDASNRYDEEASDAEFSDDEAEAAARRVRRRARPGASSQEAPDLATAAQAAGGGGGVEGDGRRRGRSKRSRGNRSSAGGAHAPAGDMGATIAAQQAQIAALQARIASMHHAMASSHTMAPPGMGYTAPAPQFQAGMVHFPASHTVPPAHQHAPSSAAAQFMAAASRAAAAMNRGQNTSLANNNAAQGQAPPPPPPPSSS